MAAPTTGLADRARGTVLVLASAICFGAISLLTVLAAREGMTILSIVFWRFLFAALVLTVIAHAAIRTHLRDGLPLVAAGGFMQALASYMSLSSLRFIPASVVAFLFFTYPAWLALTSAARGVEPLTPKRGGILLLAMVGVTLMIGIPGIGTSAKLNSVGVALALGSAVLYSAYLPVVNHLQREIPQIAGAFYIIAGALITYFLVGVLVSPPWSSAAGALASLAPPATAPAWMYVLALAIVSTVIAFFALMRGLQILGPARTSIIATTEPFFTIVLVVVFLGERLRWTTLLGGACIAAAVIAIAREKVISD